MFRKNLLEVDVPTDLAETPLLGFVVVDEKDGELTSLPGAFPAQNSDLPRQSVECGAEVVGDLADLDRPHGIAIADAVARPEDILAGFGIELGNDFVCIEVADRLNGLIEGYDFFLRYAESETRAKQGMQEGRSHIHGEGSVS
jgi:hypothetical protein